MYYQINNVLEESCENCIKNNETQFIAVLTPDEWMKTKNSFDMGIDIEPLNEEILSSEAKVNYDSITGTFSIPDRHDFEKSPTTFAFALDEKGIVFIDDCENVNEIISNIKNAKKWRLPSLERFLYDFLNQITKDDLMLLKSYELELDQMELAILNEDPSLTSDRVYEIRSNIRDLRNHYEELIDIGQVFEANENKFFKEENIRYFSIYLNRLDRLYETASSIRDYTMQIRDLYKMHLDIKQNNIMTILTVVTSIFMPLTLIVGWYGMNFKYMPELEFGWAYPMVFVLSLIILVGGILYFKRKKWL
ncbi:CorA family divalent cation transporter [uncultured Methanobrevibacter sp.]|uniref:magnesium transporter CorA family protein n=1 Tax=uncultured Methanobrevibacter sp. TaxID=253161 RepID=UPI002617B4D6